MSEEQLQPGQTVQRDSQGRFEKVTLASETASAMGKKSAHDRWSGDEQAQRLLEEEGYTKDNPAPEYVTIMAAQAVKSPPALIHWRRYHSGIGLDERVQAYMQPPARGEVCQLCGRGDQQSELSKLIAVMDAINEE